MNIFILPLVFMSTLSFFLFIRYFLFSVEESQNEAINRRLNSVGNKSRASQMLLESQLFRKKKDQNKIIQKFISQLSINHFFQKLIKKAGDPISIETLLLIIVLLQFLAILISIIVKAGFYTFLVMAIMGYMPIFVLKTISQKRLSVFETQFPEATDLMARALRSGHSFSSALGMVAQEMHSPIAEEFAKVSEDYAYGKTMEDALSGLMERIELTDVNFFVTAVLLQRETGGNLTEVLDNIGYIIRERFRLLRTVKTLSAEGRLSGIILALMAPALMGVLYIVSPEYINMAFEHPVGQTMLMIGGFFEVMGILVIRYLVNLEV